MQEIAPKATQFVALTPCRVIDTRTLNQPVNTQLDLNLSGACAIHPLATAVSLNVTVVPQGPLGYITVAPPVLGPPTVTSLMNSLDGRIKANAAIVALSDDKHVVISTTQSSHVVVDVNGYFIPPGTPGADEALAFYPLAPCRVMDTRNVVGPLGGPMLEHATARTIPVRSSNCGIPADAKAYSLNATVVPRTPVGYLTLWPTGSNQPVVSTLNALTGTPVANAAIVAAGVDGSIDAFVSGVGDLVLDVNGYFAAPGKAGALNYYPVLNCRVGDTRNATALNLNGGGLIGGTARTIPDAGYCIPQGGAKAYVFNATLVPAQATGYLTLWPSDLAQQPVTSTLNALDGALTSNMAIVPASATGGVSLFSTQTSHLVLDLSGYFK